MGVSGSDHSGGGGCIAGSKSLQSWACGIPLPDPFTHLCVGKEEEGPVAFQA